jgi:hypothetical protein
MKERTAFCNGERGSAGVKFLITITIIFLIGNAGFNYVPVAYDAESLKTEMQTAVLQGLALPGKMNPVDNVKTRIATAVSKNNAPPETFVDVRMKGNVLTAHVAYSKKVDILPFGIYRYDYVFDHTATPSGFLLDQQKQ